MISSVSAPPPHEHRVRVRYGETDQMGVVYHAEYLAWMDEGRTQLLEELGFPYAEVERQGYGLAVRRCDLRYRFPARFGDVVRVLTRVLRVRGASVAFAYEILRVEEGRDGPLLATGSVELACTSLSGERGPRELPEPIRRALEEQVAADQSAPVRPTGARAAPD